MGIEKREIFGFTIIEMIVTIGILAFTLPVLFSIIFSITNEQIRLQGLSVAKREGDYVLNNIESILRNYAISIHSAIPLSDANKICTTQISDQTAAYFKDTYGNYIRFTLSGDKISSVSSIVGATAYLTSSKVKVSNWEITCSKNANVSLPIISVKFDICFVNPATNLCSSSRVEENFQNLHYQTKIKLRNE